MATPEEIDQVLEKAAPLFNEMHQKYNSENAKWLNEIAMLERRVKTLYEDVDLGNGDKIAVRTALSEEEMQELNALEMRRELIKKEDALEHSDELSDIAYRQLELLTANPMLTADWFRENRDKWPVADALSVTLAFTENTIIKRTKQVKNLQSFRGE